MINEKLCIENDINCFCDASTTKFNNTVIASPGFVIAYKNEIINSNNMLFNDASSNYGEIYAIYMGIQASIKEKKKIEHANPLACPSINIFSDSKISIMSLRQWIFDWWNNPNSGVNNLSLNSNKSVKNQDVIISIVELIAMNNIKVNFYHQSSHVQCSNPAKINDMITKFRITNKIDIDKSIAYKLCYYNGFIDNMTRNNLKNLLCDITFDENKYKKPSFMYTKLMDYDTIKRYHDSINTNFKLRDEDWYYEL